MIFLKQKLFITTKVRDIYTTDLRIARQVYLFKHSLVFVWHLFEWSCDTWKSSPHSHMQAFKAVYITYQPTCLTMLSMMFVGVASMARSFSVEVLLSALGVLCDL